MFICAVCVCRGVVEVVALLGFIQRGLCCGNAVRAIVDQVAAAIKVFLLGSLLSATGPAEVKYVAVPPQ